MPMVEPAYQTDDVVIHCGNCLDVLPSLSDESVHAVITDPPYNLTTTGSAIGGFMGQAWDATGIAFRPDVWRECYRVLTPGGYLISFGGSRTWHRMVCAIEDAGFEIRDSIAWLYGSGFPKSLDVSKAIDKAAGAERDVIGHHPNPAGNKPARQWQGWGTALKPGHEPIVVARKPLSGTVAATVLAHGTGALNIDGCRIPSTDDTRRNARGGENGLNGSGTFKIRERSITAQPMRSGRWPANVVLTHTRGCSGGFNGQPCVSGCPVAELDAQSGKTTSQASAGRNGGDQAKSTWGLNREIDSVRGHNDSGGASRFFPVFRYQAKAPTLERPYVDGIGHPTVKPLALMQWLIRLVTPPNGIVLDPFIGSGTTAEACRAEGFRCIGIEKEPEYIPLIGVRID